MSRRTRALLRSLSRRGPHRVLRGDLAFVGIPGVLYTPESGFGLPGVAFGHDWLTGVDHYTATLEHLASWGVVAAAPNTGRGLAPSVLALGHDLTVALDVISGVRLGPGRISVAPDRLGLAGHGFGASAAVFAAAERPQLPKAVAAVFPSVTQPSAVAAATRLRVPGLVLATPQDATSLRTDAAEVARSWDGAVLRVVKKADAAGLAEKRRLRRMLGVAGSNTRTQRTVRALITGFLLFHLTRDKTYRPFADADVALPRTAPPDPDAEPVTTEDRIVALFR